MLASTPEPRWSSYANVLSRSVGSFARLTDQTALSAQPERLDVVQVSSGMTLSTFLQRYPSTEEPEIVALVNHLDGNARLDDGAVYKRIVGGR